MTILYVLAALLMLGVMVTVHEAGHFFAARLTGIPVREFAIGFGPKLLTWKSKKHETQFSLRLIPAGGFCGFYGEDDVEGKAVHDPRALQNYSVWKRMLTIVMGPIMNFVLAFLVCFAFYQASGVTYAEYGRAQIAEITQGGAAEEAGFEKGDFIETVNGQNAAGLAQSGADYRVQELINAYQTGDEPLAVVVTLGTDTKTLYVTPRADQTGRMLIGISILPEVFAHTEHLTVFGTLGAAWSECVAQGGAILSSLKNLIFKGEGADQMSGPVGVISIITEETQKYGLSAYLSLLVFISVNLGLVNLLPIPGLDGSRVVFLLIEAIRGKPVPQKVEAYIHMAGFFLLIGLFLVLTWQDLSRLF